MPDAPRPVATSPDIAYSLSIQDAVQLYAEAGHPRTPRTIQRFCALGHLECVKAATLLGDKYFIKPSSLARHIAQIEELSALASRSSSYVSRHDATRDGAQTLIDAERHVAQSPNDMSRQAATSPGQSAAMPAPIVPNLPSDRTRHVATTDTIIAHEFPTDNNDTSRQVASLEREVERLTEDKDFLREQIATKDEQISALLERDRETNILVRTLQQMLSPLLRSGRDATEDKGDTSAFR